MWEVCGEFAALPASTISYVCLVVLYVLRGKNSVTGFGACFPLSYKVVKAT